MKHLAFRPFVLAVALFGAAACSEESVGPGDGDTAPPETRSVEGVTTAVAAIIGTFADGPLDQPYLLESMAEFDTHYGGVDPHHEASYHVRAFFDNGGERIWVTRVGDADAGGLLGSRAAGTGLFALEEANRFDLLLVPEIFTSDDIVDRAFVASEAVRYASERAAMALLDPPAEVLSARDVIDWMGKAGAVLRHPHAVLYFGRVAVGEDAAAGTRRWIGASGVAAGAYARNDRERGVWTTPAGPGLVLSGVLEVDDLTPGETDALNQAQVNPVVSSNGGVVLWGGRTLTVDPEVTYIAVQRLAMHVDARVRQTLDWATGEASDSALWDAARADVEALLDGLWRDGAFQGSRTQDAYFVRSDHTTHTDDDIQAGRLNVVVGFAALRPAEFVVRRVTIEL